MLRQGKFDAPDRLFHSIQQTYTSALLNHADVKELIPEFYDPSIGNDFLINIRNLQLGNTQTGIRVHDVQLPAWAKSSKDFVKKNRKALETKFCSERLPKWIDLIFGTKSRGDEAKEANNLFHKTAYLGPDDMEAMNSEYERSQARLQAMEFGCVPDKLFRVPHPMKGESIDDECLVARKR